MIRRQMIQMMGVFALAALFSVPALPQSAYAEDGAPCSCCGESCACESCGCGEDCCGKDGGCTEGCCASEAGAVTKSDEATPSDCCGESCACGSCGCSGCC